SAGDTDAWNDRIQKLFKAIDEGQNLFETRIPAYNGGLFEFPSKEKDVDPENKFLAKYELEGNYVKELLELLIQTENEQGEKVFIDYEDLNIRHLGSIYEGLLEHELQEAEEDLVLESGEWTAASESSKDYSNVSENKRVEKGQVYLANESGERKATGSYYTPDYIVEYIVENTVGPKVEEKLEGHPSREEIEEMPAEDQKEAENQKLSSILDLDICDPAMGSGHFLVEATDYIGHIIAEEIPLEHQDIDEEDDEVTWAKRQVVQNCIYGVDINPLAVELGKLSLWIETMAEGKPLNFLDHHLKHGNSLIGSDFDEIFTHPNNDAQKSLDNERLGFGDPEKVKDDLKAQYRQIEKENDEETVEQVHKKEQRYREFTENNELYKQLKQVANVHTRQYFNEEVDQTTYENILTREISSPTFSNYQEEEWFQKAQQDAENRNYFHWQLEFPKVF
ncbi:MAG: Eco57I restriction-modification methylase domain-containing protein, partial [Candidatus Nanohalobium sp.]